MVLYLLHQEPFRTVRMNLYKRALKAYFKLSRCFGDVTPTVNTFLHLFDHMVKPILLYGSEIWGTINPFSVAVKRNFNSGLERFVSQMQCDKLHMKCLKIS